MDAKVFKLNLKTLLHTRGLKQSELAEKCGLYHPWVRRICSQGLTRVEARNRTQLQAICDFFEISPLERLWSPDLHAVRNDAAYYGSKLEAILNKTHSIADFNEFVDIDEKSVIDLVRVVDQLHIALKANHSKLSGRHAESLGTKTIRNGSDGRLQLQDYHEVQQSIEYPAKLQAVLRSLPEPFEVGCDSLLNFIDGAYYFKDIRHIEVVLQNDQPSSLQAWLGFFGRKIDLYSAIGASLSKFTAIDILNWLGENSPPSRSSIRPSKRSCLIRDGLKASLEANG